MNNKLYRYIFVLLGLLLPLTLFAEPSGRGYDPNAPDLGLPSGSEVGYGVLIAIIAIPLGYWLIRSTSEDNSGTSFLSVLGLILIGGGIVCLIPLVAWICSIASFLLGIGIAAIVIIGLIVLITNFFKNK